MRGGDRQEAHERIRGYALEAARRMTEGEEGGLFERVAGDEELGVSAEELEAMARAEGLVGRAVEQVDRFLEERVGPVLGRGGEGAGVETADVRV